ncbi:4HB MCP domain protein [Acididesulfobacillus acetoxydans]|uniref:4HB MCP domain protein n=1 Tax=Acididesulfobacillus acetoxydans TaxID=1561005 RepID=A0A8S0WW78_9FIRM|nr:MCP four helix bundle domain-containing protein [Acididesulfobacillus acetoxydans]CAA7600091.1 4HB MCP domain protein [Acididesulfobacillus acetoxydans]CEJ07665.1 Methyl-accepting chemotaxis sensory transducer [Acididesulfobacillus acetoxydans]
MRFLNNVTWKVKLTTGFAVLVVLVAFMGYLGIMEMGEIDARGGKIYSDSLVPVIELNHIKADLRESTVDIQQLYIEQDKIQHTNSSQQLQAAEAQFRKDEQIYEKSFADGLPPGDKSYFSAYERAVADYWASYDRAVQFLAARNYPAAGKILQGGMQTTNETSIENLNKLIAAAENGARSRNEDNHQVFLGTRMVVLSVLGFSLLVALLLASYLSINLSRRLSEIAQFAGGFGLGDLSRELRLYGRDEIGKMGDALRQAMQNVRELLVAIHDGSESMSA